ncbi:MAG: hypothetical protein QOF82_645 [Frankiales bacterium]|nr:hypothetical protein [Frankiales bacterium]
MATTLRSASVLLTALAAGFAFVPSVNGTHVSTPAAHAEAGAATQPSMVLQTAGSPHWYSKNITASQYSSPAVAAVGPKGAQEIVVGFPDGTVQGWALNGAHLWTFKTGAGAVTASPVIVDLNKDGHLDVITANTAGNVWGFTPSLGNKVIFHKNTGDGVHEPGDFATPAVADINKDGKLDVVETSWDHHIHVWSGAGTHKELPGFPVFLKDTVWSSPAVADIDGDGWPEIAFGYDCAGVKGQDCYKHPGGYVGVLRHDGKWQKGWPKWQPQVIWSSPAIVDLFGNGKKEIVVGTGAMPNTTGRRVLAFTSGGHYVPGFPSAQKEEVTASPAIGDVDGDGKKDIVYVSNDGILHVVNRAGKITASTCLAGSWHTCPISYRANAAIADVNNDGKMDIIVGNELSMAVYDKVGGTLVKKAVYGTYGYQPGAFVGSPTITQVGNQTWIVAATSKPGALNVGKVFIWKLNNKLGKAPWPTFKQSFARLGVAPK